MTTPTSNLPPATATAAAASTWNTPSLVMGGLGLVAVGALSAVLLMGNRSATPEAPAVPVAVVASAPLLAASSATATPPVLVAATAPDDVPAAAPAVAPLPAKPAVVTKTAAPPHKAAAKPTPSSTPQPAATDSGSTTPSTTEPTPGVRSEAAAAEPAPKPAPKPVCATCGVVTAVTPVQQQGEAGAVGTVAGGVLGGVLGHQMGGGHGKDAMTVIGAIGGALAGREVEKRQRTTTAYQIHIRMDDGGTRTFTRDQAYVVGQKVRVEGDKLSLRSGGSADNGY
jgi:outer membrane lipoprotein SlyB